MATSSLVEPLCNRARISFIPARTEPSRLDFVLDLIAVLYRHPRLYGQDVERLTSIVTVMDIVFSKVIEVIDYTIRVTPTGSLLSIANLALAPKIDRRVSTQFCHGEVCLLSQPVGVRAILLPGSIISYMEANSCRG